MAFQQGTVNSLAEIQTAIRTFLSSNGWTWNGSTNTINKDTIYIEFIPPAGDKALFVAKTQSDDICPRKVGLGRFVPDASGNTPAVISYPATFYAFLSDDEFYFVVQYEATRFQYVAWGKSTIDTGLNASHTYISGSVNDLSSYYAYNNRKSAISIAAGLASQSGRSAAPFWDTVQYSATDSLQYAPDFTSSFIHTDFGSPSWRLSVLNTSYNRYESVGNQYASNKLSVLPNMWNGESPLMPIRAYRRRDENKISLCLDLKNARQCRIDNFYDVEEVFIGSQAWIIFPFHRRDMVNRNGGNNIDHTGTFGWALRKVV